MCWHDFKEKRFRLSVFGLYMFTPKSIGYQFTYIYSVSEQVAVQRVVDSLSLQNWLCTMKYRLLRNELVLWLRNKETSFLHRTKNIQQTKHWDRSSTIEFDIRLAKNKQTKKNKKAKKQRQIMLYAVNVSCLNTNNNQRNENLIDLHTNTLTIFSIVQNFEMFFETFR